MLYACILIFLAASLLVLHLPLPLVDSMNPAWFFAALLLGFFSYFLGRLTQIKPIRALLFVFSFFLFAVLIQDWRVRHVLNTQLPEALSGLTFLAEGRVVSLPHRDGDFQRFQFQAKYIEALDNGQRYELKSAVRLSWRSDRPLHIGEYWQLRVRLKRPRGFVNPKGFDYQAWLLAKGISATGYVIAGTQTKKPVNAMHWVTAIRDRVATQLDKALLQCNERGGLSDHCGVAHAELVRALLIGDKAGISHTQWSTFKNTGTVHLMAISGLHVGLVAGFMYVLARLILRPMVFLPSPLFYRISVAGVSVSAAAFYALLAGFSVPTQRALLCAIVCHVLLLVERRSSALRFLGIIACGMAFANPFVLRQSSYVLSFLAVAALLFTFSSNTHKTSSHLKNSLLRFFLAQWVVLIALWPVMNLLQLPSSLISPFANMVAIPLLSFFILPLAFCALLLTFISDALSHLVFLSVGHLLVWKMQCLHFLADIPDTFGLNMSWQQLFGLKHNVALAIAAVFWLQPQRPRLRSVGAILFVAVLAHAHVFRQAVREGITVLDVGQGLAISVNGAKHSMIYDVGARFSDSFSIANQVLLPFIESHQHARIAHVVLSHADNDHAGDAESFVHALKKRQVAPFRVISGEAEALDIPNIETCEGDATRLNMALSELTQVTQLWPNERGLRDEASNNRSCVLLIRLHGKTILLSGDIEKRVEYRLLASPNLPQNIDLLVAPHHGSATSSTYLFLHHLKPRHVIFSAGHKNRYRHPSAAVVARYQDLGTTLWNTAYHGALSISVEAGELRVRSERMQQSRRWFDAKETFP